MTQTVAGPPVDTAPAEPPSTRSLLDGIANSSFEMGKLRRKLEIRHPECDPDHDVSEALQHAFLCAYESCDVRHEGKAYQWLAQAADYYLIDLYRYRCRVRPADASDPAFQNQSDTRAEPGRELAERETKRELKRLCRTISTRLSPRRRRVLHLWASDMSRTEIANLLNSRERTVKKDVEIIQELARQHVIAYSGHGCDEGEHVVSRYAFKLAKGPELREAQLHLAGCHQCGALFQALDLWRAKLPGMLVPVSVADPAQTVLEHACHKAADLVTNARHYLADGAEHARRHTESTVQSQADRFPRIAETATKLSVVRPGQVATFAAVCAFGVSGAPQECVNLVGAPLIASYEAVVRPAHKPEHDRHQKPRQHAANASGTAGGTASSAATSAPEPVDHSPPAQIVVSAQPPSSDAPATKRRSTPTPTRAAQQEFDPAAAAAAEATNSQQASPNTTAQVSQSTSQTSAPAPTQTSAPTTTNAKPVPADEAGLGYIGGP